MGELLDDEALRARLGRQAAAAVATYSVSGIAEQWLRLM
jgi:hypothetical protein